MIKQRITGGPRGHTWLQYYLIAPNTLIAQKMEYLMVEDRSRRTVLKLKPIDMDSFLGLIHRTDGPAIITLNEQQVEIYRAYFYYGIQYDNPEDWLEAMHPKDKQEAIWSLDGSY